MTLYFFDFTSAGVLSRDEEAIDLPDAEAAHDVALEALVDAARNAVQEGSMNQRYAVEGSQRIRSSARSHCRFQFQDFPKAVTAWRQPVIRVTRRRRFGWSDQSRKSL